jgi:GR25 family glycosyltransferase involved in LPS biosynthesis
MAVPYEDLIPVKVVSLAQATDRRLRMCQQFEAIGIPFSFFEGTDGRNMSAQEIAELDPRPIHNDNSRAWLIGELGNLSSFRRVMRSIADNDEPYVCVLEDDAVLTPHFPEFLRRSVLEKLPRFDVLRLESNWMGWYLPLTKVGAVEIAAPYRLGPLACGQVFSRTAARWIYEKMLPSYQPFDCMLYFDRRFPGLRILDVLPAVIIHGAAASQIDPAGQRCAPVNLSPVQKLRLKLFRAGCNLRIKTSFAWHWGVGAKRRCLKRTEREPVECRTPVAHPAQ